MVCGQKIGRKAAIVAMTALLVVSLALSVGASTVFVHQPVNHALSRISDWSNENQKASDFVLSSGAWTVTRIRWWGSYGASPDPAVDTFVFKFFVEDPYSPGYPSTVCLDDGTRYPSSSSTAGFSRTATAMVSDPSGSHDGGIVYEYSAVLDTPIHLDGGKRYWLAITNSTPTYAYPPQANSKWGWLESTSGSQWYRLGHCSLCADDWSVSNTKNLAFALETFPQVGLCNKAGAALMSSASTRFLFTVWGRAKITGDNTFQLDDGSGVPISAESPGFGGFSDGDYVRAMGLLDYSAGGSVLKTDAADIVKIR